MRDIIKGPDQFELGATLSVIVHELSQLGLSPVEDGTFLHTSNHHLFDISGHCVMCGSDLENAQRRCKQNIRPRQISKKRYDTKYHFIGL